MCSKGHNADYVKKGNSEISLLIALFSSKIALFNIALFSIAKFNIALFNMKMAKVGMHINNTAKICN